MMKAIPCRFQVQLFLFLGLIVLVFIFLGLRRGDHRIPLAEESYRKGESASTLAERNEEFNQALDLFLQLDGDYRPNFGSGKLSYNIGNTYFQLGEYPQSILYYMRAENLMPRSQVIKRSLSLARNKLGLSQQDDRDWLDLFLLKPYVSLPERLQVFFALASLALFFCSIWLWTKKQWSSNGGVISLSLLAIVTINLVVTYYFSSVEGVLVKAVELRRDAGVEFAKVSDQPISAGTTVEVVGMSPDVKWMKVVAPNGEFGYAPGEAVKLVDL